MSRARDFANLAGAADAGTISGDNIVINGDMAIWQRGTSIDTIANGSYLCDRWRIAHAGLDGNVDVDRSTDVPSGQGFRYSQKISMDASETSLDADDQLNLQQRFEGQDLQHILKGTSSAKSVTLSFWVKSSVAETYSVNFRDNDNTRVIASTYVINAANTWEKKTITFAGDTTGTLDNDNNRSIDLTFYMDAGTSFTGGTFASSWGDASNNNVRVSATTGWLESTSPEFYITGVKLEVGSTATPFQHESYADNLRKCQRYYEELNEDNVAQYIAGGWQYSDAGYWNWLVKYTPKRATPTLVGNWSDGNLFYVYSDGAGLAITSFTTNGASTAQTIIHSSSADRGNGGIAGGLYCNSASARMAFNAEL